MADIELLSRHMAVNQIVSGDVSAGVYMFANWLNIQTFECVAALVLRGPGAGALTAMRIDVASTAAAADATNGPTLTNPGNINAAQETALIECRASDLQGYLATARWCNIHLNSAAAVPVVATLIRYNPRYAFASLTTANETAWT